MRFLTADPVYLDAEKKQVPRLFQEYPKWVYPNGVGVLVNDAAEEAAAVAIESRSEEAEAPPAETAEPVKRKPGRPRKSAE